MTIQHQEKLTPYYREVLDAAGYTHAEPTEENVRCCFIDYVAAGYFQNVSLDDLDDITLDEMCLNLLRGR